MKQSIKTSFTDFHNSRNNVIDQMMIDAEAALNQEKAIVTDDMRQNAPWEDHTWKARKGLRTEVFRKVNFVILQVSHHVHYGHDLELYYGKKYAILYPTILKNADKFVQKVAGYSRAKGRRTELAPARPPRKPRTPKINEGDTSE